MSDVVWNPWHGCRKKSEGCQNCFVHSADLKHGRDSTKVTKTENFNLPVQKNKSGEYKIKTGTTVFTCFTSDFFLEDADQWRGEAWKFIKERNDLRFLFLTKRIERFFVNLPPDWGKGYENVTICCTVENQRQADYRLPIYFKLPIAHKIIICQPLLEKIDLSPYLNKTIEMVVAGGESGIYARVCKYEWLDNLRKQCIKNKVEFAFKQTGARFEKNGKIYNISKKDQHSQARKASINWKPDKG